MRLLAPWFSLGLLFVLGPILIHLIGRDRAPRRAFPPARLLLAAQRKVSPRAHLERWLLALLRALAIAAVAVVLSRPIWEHAASLPTTAGLRQAAVIVLDDSLSMARRDGRRSLFDQARRKAQDLARAFPEGSEVAVISTTDPTRDPLGRIERDRAAVAQAIGRATVSARAGATSAALARAAALLASVPAPYRRVYLISDLAAAGFDESHPRPFEAGSAADAIGLDALRVGAAPPPNDAMIAIEISTAGDRTTRRLRVTAHLRSGGRAAHDRTASLLIDGTPVARGLVSLPAEGVADKRFEYAVPAGVEPRWVEVALDPDGDDALPLDDRRAAPVHGEGGRLLLVDGAPGASRREDETFYLETALRSARGAGALLDVVHEEQLAGIDLADVAAVFLCNPRPSAALAALRSFVERGGGLFVSLGDNLDASVLSSQLAQLLPSAIAGTRDLSGPGGVAGGALRLAPPTPALLARTPSLGDERGREAWRAARTYRVALLSPIPDDDPRRDVLARFEDGTPALEERQVGEGRTLLLATTIDRAWSDLAIQSVFPALAAELAEHLGAARAGAAEADLIAVGQPALRPLSRLHGDRPIELELVGPGAERMRFRHDPKRVSTVGAPIIEAPGRYTIETLESPTAGGPITFAGVLDPAESDPRLLADLDHLSTPTPLVPPGRLPAAELWHGVAALLLLLLLAEALLGLRA